MCGRFYFDIEENLPAFMQLREKIRHAGMGTYATHEVFPSQQVLVFVDGGDSCLLSIKKWGLESYNGNLLINARNETLREKKTFQTMLTKRCIIPCNGFYEWKKTSTEKKKIYIHNSKQPLLYLAGIYNDQNEFVIITEEARGRMKSIHHRTPFILKKDQIVSYLQMKWDPSHAEQVFVFDEII